MIIHNVLDDIFVINDIVEKEIQNCILESILGDNHFPWFLSHRIGNPESYPFGTYPTITDNKITDSEGFYHMAHNGELESHTFKIFEPVLQNYLSVFNKVITKILRIRLRYTSPALNHNNYKYAAPHIDDYNSQEFKTIVYYINDSDGDTILFDKIYDPTKDIKIDTYKFHNLKEVFRFTPKKGTALVFNGFRYHSGNFPINYNSRIIANYDFLEEEREWIRI